MPDESFESPTSIRRARVSSFLAEIIQQIQFLRAFGVMSSHVVCAAETAASAFLKSAGILCTIVLEVLAVIDLPYHQKELLTIISYLYYAKCGSVHVVCPSAR